MIIKVIGSAEDKPISIKIKDLQYVDGIITDYPQLTNKPQINGHELDGDQSASDLGLGTYTAPDGGIPKSDLATAVAENLDEGHTAMQRLDYDATDTDVGKALTATSVKNNKVTAYGLEEITRPYVVVPSRPVIYYDPDAAEGEQLSPSSLTVDIYRTRFDSSLEKTAASLIYVYGCNAEGSFIHAWRFRNVSTFTLDLSSSSLPPDGYLSIELQNNQNTSQIYQRFSIPVIPLMKTSKIDKPANPAVGSFLMWNGSAWIAQVLETWHEGGGY